MSKNNLAIGRPEASEVASYYFTYIDRAIGENILATLADQLEETLTFCSSISEEESMRRYAANKWSIRQVLNHLSDSERVFAFRAFWFARGFEVPLPSYDQEVAASGADADAVAWSEHVEEFRGVRKATISMFQNMSTYAWLRRGIASDNHFTVRSLAYIIAGHVNHHLALLRERYLRTSATEEPGRDITTYVRS